MALKKKPVTGMKDILPREMEIRNYVMNMIRETYGTFGFSAIETPCVEHIENLCSKQGGENEKLIFKILKRGEKLKLDKAESEADLVDSGLRYDLTVPLSRYYSNNANELPAPFKALQMGNVWRADRPQRGRFRQFMQCDIDILGEPTYLAEIELVLATTTLLGKLDFHNFTIRINDRKILKAMAQYSGFPQESFDTVFIILDKMDKIGLEGVAEELEKEGFAKDCIDTYLGMFQEITSDIQGVRFCKDKLKDVLDPKVAEKKEVPMLNTALQLTVIYFIQELRRPNQKKDDMVRMKRLQELEEEMIADLVRSRFILAVDFSKVEGEIEPGKTNPNVQVPVVKAPNGDAFQPIFTDVWEFQKFHKNPEVKLRMAPIEFKGLLGALVPQAKGFVLNPNGVNLILSREQLTAITKKFS